MLPRTGDASIMNVIVNGANGILGRYVVARAGGTNVIRATRHYSRQSPNKIIIDSEGITKNSNFEGVDAIINCVGVVNENANEIRRANVTHVKNLATAAKSAGVRNFIQVSSFAVYGNASFIDKHTPVAPNSLYGESKRDAETILSALHDSEFRTLSVRLPFMFDAENPALLRRLVSAYRVLPYWPVSSSVTYRSMLTYSDAAELLVLAARSAWTDYICAADPVPFTFDMLSNAMRTSGQKSPRLITIPPAVECLGLKLVPSITNRIMRSNLLADENNILSKFMPKVGIQSEVMKICQTL
jgi:nucleoside-diphosphate-sugar epimerase